MRRTGRSQPRVICRAQEFDDQLQRSICRAPQGWRWLQLFRFHAKSEFRYCGAQSDRGRARTDRWRLCGLSGWAGARSGCFSATGQETKRAAARRFGKRPSARAADGAEANQHTAVAGKAPAGSIETDALRGRHLELRLGKAFGSREERVCFVAFNQAVIRATTT